MLIAVVLYKNSSSHFKTTWITTIKKIKINAGTLQRAFFGCHDITLKCNFQYQMRLYLQDCLTWKYGVDVRNFLFLIPHFILAFEFSNLNLNSRTHSNFWIWICKCCSHSLKKSPSVQRAILIILWHCVAGDFLKCLVHNMCCVIKPSCLRCQKCTPTRETKTFPSLIRRRKLDLIKW